MNELESSKTWYKRGSTYRAKSLEALKTLYTVTDENPKPGSDPKGVKRKETPDAPTTSETIQNYPENKEAKS